MSGSARESMDFYWIYTDCIIIVIPYEKEAHAMTQEKVWTRDEVKRWIEQKLVAQGLTRDDVWNLVSKSDVDFTLESLNNDAEVFVEYIPETPPTTARSEDFAELGGCPGSVPFGEVYKWPGEPAKVRFTRKLLAGGK